VYQLGPRSWKPNDSLSQTVSENDAKQTCQLSHDVLQSEMLPLVDDEDLLLDPADEVEWTCFILSTDTKIQIDSVMRPRSSSRGHNTSTSVTVTANSHGEREFPSG